MNRPARESKRARSTQVLMLYRVGHWIVRARTRRVVNSRNILVAFRAGNITQQLAQGERIEKFNHLRNWPGSRLAMFCFARFPRFWLSNRSGGRSADALIKLVPSPRTDLEICHRE